MTRKTDDPERQPPHLETKEKVTAHPKGIGWLVVGIGCLYFAITGMSDVSHAASGSPTGAMGMGLAFIACGLLFFVGAAATLSGLVQMASGRKPRPAGEPPARETLDPDPNVLESSQSSDARWKGITCLVLGAISLLYTLVGLFDISDEASGSLLTVGLAFCFGVVVTLVGLFHLFSDRPPRR